MYIYNYKGHYKTLTEECIEKLNAIHFPIAKSILFKQNTGYSKYGYCKKNRGKETVYTIAINKWLEDDIAIKETIMHELIHTIPGCYNHGRLFHDYAYEVYRVYGIKISVTGNHKLNEKAYKNKGIRRKVFRAEEFDKATMVMMYCPKCQNTFAIKKTAFKWGSRWVCKRCREKLLYL